MPWNENLVGTAYEIAAYPGPCLTVLAGPGTGKSFSMTRRVARLLEEGYDPERILAVTFTRTAAADMEREIRRLDVPGANQIVTGTLHSLCFQVLLRTNVLETTGRVPRTLLKFEADCMLSDLRDAEFGSVREKRARLRAYEAAWARLQVDTPGGPPDPVDRLFQERVTSWLRFHKGMLIGELVPQALSYLRTNPHAPERRRFVHVLVDEYQDLNRAEQELIRLLSQDAMLTVVGDDDQSIYSFKYANPDGIINFPRDYPHARLERLEDCRRCPQSVVTMARTLIQGNQHRINKTLNPQPQNPMGEVHIAQWESFQAEVEGISRAVQHLITGREVPPNEILILTPRRQLGYAIRTALRARGVNAHSCFHEDLLKSALARERYTLLNLIASPLDRVALRTWLGLQSQSHLTGSYRRISDRAAETGEEPRAVLEQVASGQLELRSIGPLLERYQELQDRVGLLEGSIGQHFVNLLIPEDHEDVSDFKEVLLAIAADYDTPAQIFEEVRRYITQPDPIAPEDAVRIMSFHKSKGLSATAVFLVGCVEGLIPDVSEEGFADAERTLQEQRRLFYVGLTRTRNLLFISYPYRLQRGFALTLGAVVENAGIVPRTVPTRFLGELGPTCPAPVMGLEALRQMGVV